MTPAVYSESRWRGIALGQPDGSPELPEWAHTPFAGINQCDWREFSSYTVQQQSWNNGNNDGLWRWMPSIAVDQNGNTAIGYSTSSATQEPSIRYAGRLAADPLNNLAQAKPS